MKKSYSMQWIFAAAFTAGVGAAIPALAQNAPGEDPVILSKRVAVQMVPLGGARPSSPLQLQTEMPAWMKAKVARYEARFNSDPGNGLLTDSDATRTATSDGFKRTCIQEVGSSTAASSAASGKNGVGNNQQIVVLRGDLVNICK